MSFAPSRKRAVPATAATAVGGVQPGGRALPSLVLGEPRSAGGHVSAARAVHPVGSLISVALGSDTRALRSDVAAGPCAVVARRPMVLATFRSTGASLEERRVSRMDKLDASRPARNIHLPFLHFSLSKLEYSDATAVRDLAAGIPIGVRFPRVVRWFRERSRQRCRFQRGGASVASRNRDDIMRAGADRNS